VFPSAIKLLSSSNNGSRGFTPQTTPKMISLSEDILFVVDLGYLEPFLGIVLLTRRCETSGPICCDNTTARDKPQEIRARDL
jgi:hypothetical protein